MKANMNNRTTQKQENNDEGQGDLFMESPVPFVLQLNDVTRAHTKYVGVKAANLGEMLRASSPVPDGFVLTTEAFAHFLAVNALDTASSQDTVARALFPTEIATILRASAALYGETPLAVRSSGVAEDLPGASFAGLYETVLDVRGFDALVGAVQRCWASAFSERVAAYRAATGNEQKGGMAVLIQRLVHADASGVAFSANPITGDRLECVVNAVRGLGERLVSGQATPDAWTVRGQDVVRHSAPEGAITAPQALAVAELARRAAAHFGAPQDVEWAIADDQLFLLQARPITALPEPAPTPVPIPIEPLPGFWEREATHFPDPLSPMLRSAILPLHERAMYQSMQENFLLIDGVQFREIGGWLYQRVVPMAGDAHAMHRRITGLVDVVQTDKLARDVERWYTEWKPNTLTRINQLKRIELTSLSDSQLVQHLEQVRAFIAACLNIHALITAADFIVMELVLLSQELLGWDARKSLELLSGLSSRTTAPTQRLSELVRLAQHRPTIRTLLDHLDPHTMDRLATVDPEFGAAVDRYLQEFGCRTLSWDFNKATLMEQPQLVLQMIRDQLARNYDLTAEVATLQQNRVQRLAEAQHVLSTLSTATRHTFERALTRAERAYPIREEHEFYLSNVPFALMRTTLLELGTRLTAQGTLEQRDDIFFLEFEEARAVGAEDRDLHATVRQRKGEQAWARAHPGPAFYGQPPPPPPSMTAFPPEVQHVMHVMSTLIESLFASQYSQHAPPATADAIHGIAASPGQYTGPVRIIMSQSEFSKLQVGDVMVCPTTQPPWSVLFPSVGALVTDSGGILSHPAIIAREYHVPAVVATRNATSILRDGQVVTVDGTTGRVILTA
jgi:pyruvate,water dikinase